MIGRDRHVVLHGAHVDRLQLQRRRGVDKVDALVRFGGVEGVDARPRVDEPMCLELPPRGPVLELVEVAGDRPRHVARQVRVGDELTRVPGAHRAVERQMRADREPLRLAGQAHLGPCVTARLLRTRHGVEAVAARGDVEARRRHDRGAHAVTVAAAPHEPDGFGELGDAMVGERMARHLLQAQHVGRGVPDDAQQGRAVVLEAAHVVRHKTGGHAMSSSTALRARSAAPMSPASLPSCACTIRASGR